MFNLKEMLLPLMLALCIMYPLAFSVSEDILLINYHIHIINDLPLEPPTNVPSLNLHCKSKDKDLGERAMFQHQDYAWDSKINLFRTTLFFCNARWRNKKQRYFEAFKATRDEDRCLDYHFSCIWSVRYDGIYFSSDNYTWTMQYPW
ncbi:hypothetical protein E1A91_A09G059300v1 [Gossypium mustelinum]|uniref:S-protein homolog n=2 Tax=Gossypium TaxID=3633 RepID=A0A5D2XX86_GOSMU|nr:S-protein homolog 18-like [Gossypium arboreum]TYJ17551.1 hypothetical protein E1A91_A09G059300v1 [Gossypium mustelinum]